MILEHIIKTIAMQREQQIGSLKVVRSVKSCSE